MTRLAQTPGLTDTQQSILDAVRVFVDKEIIPRAQQLEHADEYPVDIVEHMREMGLFGLTIDEEYGGLGESLLAYALMVEQLSRGWMSVSGIINTHFMVAYLIARHGTEEQKRRLLPQMATGEVRGAFSMSEPGTGSDVAAIRSRAVRADDGTFVLRGQKMWLTNGAYSSIVATLVRTDDAATTPHDGLTAFLLEKQPGFGQTAPGLTITGRIEKMGYKGVETTEMILDGMTVPASAVLGGPDQVGRGFYQMMDGIEVGRVNIAARACGVSLRAFELAIAYAQQRQTFGKPLAAHQAIAFKLGKVPPRSKRSSSPAGC